MPAIHFLESALFALGSPFSRSRVHLLAQFKQRSDVARPASRAAALQRLRMEIPMQTKRIPKSEWPAFLDSFSRQHEGWLVKLEIFGPEIGVQVEETGLTLDGLTNEWDEVSGHTIIISTGSAPDDHITHSISRSYYKEWMPPKLSIQPI